MTSIIEPNEDIKVGEKIEIISPETIQVPDYSYGVAQNTIDGPIGIRNLSGGAKLYCGYTTRSASTGTQSITGVGFKPTMIVIQAIYANGILGSVCNGQAMLSGSTLSSTCVVSFANPNAGAVDYYTNRFIRVNSSSGTSSRANIVSMDSDGFTIEWTTCDLPVNFIYQCYG